MIPTDSDAGGDYLSIADHVLNHIYMILHDIQ